MFQFQSVSLPVVEFEYFMAVLAKNTITLTMRCSDTSDCSPFAGCNVHLQYKQTVELSAEASSFPKIPMLVLLNSAQEKLAASSSTGAHRVELKATVNEVGRYTFRLANTLESVFVEVTGI